MINKSQAYSKSDCFGIYSRFTKQGDALSCFNDNTMTNFTDTNDSVYRIKPSQSCPVLKNTRHYRYKH